MHGSHLARMHAHQCSCIGMGSSVQRPLQGSSHLTGPGWQAKRNHVSSEERCAWQAPVVGRWSDGYGRKPFLILSFLCGGAQVFALLAYLKLGTLPLLGVSRPGKLQRHSARASQQCTSFASARSQSHAMLLSLDSQHTGLHGLIRCACVARLARVYLAAMPEGMRWSASKDLSIFVIPSGRAGTAVGIMRLCPPVICSRHGATPSQVHKPVIPRLWPISTSDFECRRCWEHFPASPSA